MNGEQKKLGVDEKWRINTFGGQVNDYQQTSNEILIETSNKFRIGKIKQVLKPINCPNKKVNQNTKKVVQQQQQKKKGNKVLQQKMEGKVVKEEEEVDYWEMQHLNYLDKVEQMIDSKKSNK